MKLGRSNDNRREPTGPSGSKRRKIVVILDEDDDGDYSAPSRMATGASGRCGRSTSLRQHASIDRGREGSGSQYTPYAVVDISFGRSSLARTDMDNENATNVAVTELVYPFTKYMELFVDFADWGETRWVIVRTPSGREYKVRLEMKFNYYMLSKGWALVVAVECLHVYQTLRLERQENVLFLTCVTPRPRGSQPGFMRGPTVLPRMGFNDYVLGPGTQKTYNVTVAMQKLWALTAPIAWMPMYACTVRGSQQTRGAMYFSKEYSSLMPKEKKTVALRFLDSPVAITGTISLYRKKTAKIASGWAMFVQEHKIVEGNELVFRCGRGPNVYEVVVCRA